MYDEAHALGGVARIRFALVFACLLVAGALLLTLDGFARRAGSIDARRPGTRRELARRLHRARDYMHAHLERDLPLEEIAAAAALSPHHFLRRFRAVFGQTPHAYLMQARVERAKELLRRGDGIAEAAYGAGFADQAHLTRRFKGFVGVTPREFVRGAVCR